MNKTYLLITIILYSFQLLGQNQSPYQKDVQSIDAIMEALTDVISGAADQERDWERFKFLFAKDGKLIPTQTDANGNIVYNYWSPDDYIAMYKKNRGGTAFYETEIYRTTGAFGNIAHCFSTYAVRTSENGPIERRGVNSIQLLKGNDRWYIMNVFWSNEDEKNPLPEKYLPKK